MKKLILLLVLSFGLGITSPGFSNSIIGSGKSIYLDEADKCFLEYLSVDIDSAIEYSRTELFDEHFEHAGWNYNFTLNSKTGYVLLSSVIIDNSLVYEVEEFSLKGFSPFLDSQGIPVYLTRGVYIDYYNNEFFDLVTNNIISEEDIFILSQKGFGYNGGEEYQDENFNYSGGGEAVNQTEVIEYDYKTVDEYSINGNLPNYYGQVGGSNCANVAGAVVLGYYDRMFENLIPNYKTYTKLGSVIKYRGQSVEIEDCMDNLYQLMETDINQAGTTYSGFQNGMKKYVANQGYTYNTQSVLSFGSMDLNKFTTAVRSGKPVVLFLSEYTIVQNEIENQNSDIVYTSHISVSHVVAACGYKVEKYYNENEELVDQRVYLKVASGFLNYGIAYLRLDNNAVDHAIAITIN